MANKTLSDFPVLANPDAASVVHVQKELVDYQVPLDTLTRYVTENAEYSDLGNKIDGAEEKTTPVDADMIGLMDGVSKVLKKLSWLNIKATLKTYFDSLYQPSGGWITAGETWTYASADAPTFTFTVAADVTLKYSVGMKIKLTQTTVKYFIITAVSAYTGGNTTITVYGGTDYTLVNAAITSPYFSQNKAPFGFPMSPAKWTVEITDTNQTTQNSPVNGTWYNLGNITISIPVGLWDVQYRVTYQGLYASNDCFIVLTLSTANNSESDVDLSTSSSGYSRVSVSAYIHKFLSVASKTSYYLNFKAGTASMTSISVRGDLSKTIIRAICAYL